MEWRTAVRDILCLDIGLLQLMFIVQSGRSDINVDVSRFSQYDTRLTQQLCGPK